MAHGDRRGVSWAWHMSWRLLGALGCSGPDLAPTLTSAEPPSADPFNVILPERAYCGPLLLPATDAVPLAGSGAAPGIDSETCPDGSARPRLEHTPLRPLGVGYRDGSSPLPRGVAYLTFDDGPSEWTHSFLDILGERGVKGTFFVTAKQLKGEQGLNATYVDENGATVVYRDVLKRIVDDGHVLGNHTVNHPDMARITRAQLTSEIEQNELLVSRALLRAGGQPRLLPLFRPPYGSPWYTGIGGRTEPLASERLSSHGLNIMWNVTSTDAADWADGESYSRTAVPAQAPGAPTYAAKLARVKQAVIGAMPVSTGDGMIVLMHDTHNATLEALGEIIDGLAAAGYSFETVEHYVEWRWGRPGIDLTPGPHLYDACIDERDWGCLAVDAPLGADRSKEVCGRMWLAYEALGGAETLGAPIEAPSTSPETGIVSQSFEHTVVELHPENPAPCNVVAIPR